MKSSCKWVIVPHICQIRVGRSLKIPKGYPHQRMSCWQHFSSCLLRTIYWLWIHHCFCKRNITEVRKNCFDKLKTWPTLVSAFDNLVLAHLLGNPERGTLLCNLGTLGNAQKPSQESLSGKGTVLKDLISKFFVQTLYNYISLILPGSLLGNLADLAHPAWKACGNA
jgi:hypothetical protein